MKSNKYHLSVIASILLISLLISCKTESLKTVSPFPVGVAVGETPLKNNPDYRKVVISEFSSVTPENAGKIEALHPAENVFVFTGLDSIVDFAAKNNIRVHGTTLIWHDISDLAWVKNFDGDSLAWEHMFKNHIQTVAAHYKGMVRSWDVVNEPFHSDGTLRIDEVAGSDDPGSIWARHLGPDYIARAFQYAHEADPEAILILNDFDLQYSKYQKKIDAVVNLANDFKKRGIPIGGLGMQMHIGVSASNEEIASGLRQLASTGLMVHISEVSILVSDWKRDTSLVFSPELQKKQADKYESLVRVYEESVPAAQRYGITVWGVSDSNSWIMPTFNLIDWPLLFDGSFRKKPAYYGFLKGLSTVGSWQSAVGRRSQATI
jgi:endo-1,4-beta-xylanase